jgi:hypothetical protein
MIISERDKIQYDEWRAVLNKRNGRDKEIHQLPNGHTCMSASETMFLYCSHSLLLLYSILWVTAKIIAIKYFDG